LTVLTRERITGRASIPAAALSLALGVVVVLLARWGPDWPAQEFRAWLAAHDGLTAWTSRWYGGQALPGYSVLYPVLSGVIGAGAVGVASIVVATWAASSMGPTSRVRSRWFTAAVVVSLTQSLLIGQIPFLLGVAFGLLAIQALSRPRSLPWVAVCAALCSLSSPLSGACLLLAVPALAVTYGWRRAAALSTSIVGVLVSAVVGGASGPFPFQWQSFMGVLLFCGLTLLLTPADNRALRRFALCYLCVALAIFFVANPIGGNVARIGKLIAMPLAARFLTVSHGIRRRVIAGLAVVMAVAWPSLAFASSIARGASDPTQRADYYTGVLRFLRTQNAMTGRLEIPFTREHWESLWIAKEFPIARGWERQTDLQYNQVLYQPLTAVRYHQWLDDNAISLVALPNAPIDYGGRAEQTLLKHPPSYLRPVWHDANWQVWQVVGAKPIVTGSATMAALDSSSLSLSFAHAGSAVVRIHGSALWRVTDGDGCVSTTPEGWLRVQADRPGVVTIDAKINSQLVIGADRCEP
jgi:hypothetical protein